MNVAIIMERIDTWRGGAETSTISFANHLADNGCKVNILTTSPIPSTPTWDIIPIKVNTLFRATKTRLFAKRAAHYIRKHSFDIVHAITPCLAADIYQPRGGTLPETLARNLAIRDLPMQRGVKNFFQHTNLKYRVVGRLEKQLLNRRHRPWVIAISQYVADQLNRHYQFDPSYIRQIFNGIDPDVTPQQERVSQREQIRRQFQLSNDDLLILCVAHNFKLKGVTKLIQALAILNDRQNRDSTGRTKRNYAIVVGRDNPAPYVNLAERLGIADQILFSGPTQRTRAFYHAADLLAHPTFYDPCSRVVLEAMAAGLPVITTRYNGAAERIQDGKQGYVIDSPNDVDVLAQYIDRLADNTHRQACASQAVRAVEDITMKDHAEKALALYEEILESDQYKHKDYR